MINLHKIFGRFGLGPNKGGLPEGNGSTQTAQTGKNQNAEGDYVEELFPKLITSLAKLQQDIKWSWLSLEDRFPNLEASNRESARNLVHYLALRRHDIRQIQNELARNGISSLGRSESHVMSNLNKVLRLLHRTLNEQFVPPEGCDDVLSLDLGARHLAHRTDALLGPPPSHRKVRIMVTLPSEAAEDYALVRGLVESGMDCARINCAHDGPGAWKRMVENIRKASKETGRLCRISIDLAGPKLRTGPFAPGPQVVKWRPIRDELGRVVKPARLWITSPDDASTPDELPSAHLHLPKHFLGHINVGDKLTFSDARGFHRSIAAVSKAGDGLWFEAEKSAYIVPETKFTVIETGEKHGSKDAHPQNLPAIEQYAFVKKGDHVVMVPAPELGRQAVTDANGQDTKAARISCSLPEVFKDVRVGEKIWFDDGKLGGTITSVSLDEIHIEITHAGPKGHRLRADKGINLPKTKLTLPALTDKDRRDLQFVVGNADIVGYSFVRTADDVRMLQKRLREMAGGQLGIVLKIETRAAFDNLPDILLAAMESNVIGVMIARGDLAVEAGFRRMAEVQEEILWMCEAAHIPVIWATQVLEQLSKKGIYSRAEITDAAMSERAECVMLNKGPYVLEAVQTLDDILTRMEAHQEKKRSMMRPLKLAERFFSRYEKEDDSLQSFLL